MSEARLGLQTGWFWLTASRRRSAAAGAPRLSPVPFLAIAVDQGGVTCCALAEEDITMPAWARMRTSRSAPQSHGHTVSRGITDARSPDGGGRQSLPPVPSSSTPPHQRSSSPAARGPRSPSSWHAVRSSRSPSPSPNQLVAFSSPAAAAAQVLPEDLEVTRHCELLAVQTYAVLRHALRLLVALAPPRQPGEVHALEQSRWPDGETLVCLQRLVCVAAHELWQLAAGRSMACAAARCAFHPPCCGACDGCRPGPYST